MSKAKPQKKPVYRRTFLKKWREYRGHTVEELAELAGTTGASVSRIENGHQPYTQELLEAFATILRCRAAEIIDRLPGPQDGPRSSKYPPPATGVRTTAEHP